MSKTIILALVNWCVEWVKLTEGLINVFGFGVIRLNILVPTVVKVIKFKSKL